MYCYPKTWSAKLTSWSGHVDEALLLSKRPEMLCAAGVYFGSCGVTSLPGKAKIILSWREGPRNGCENCGPKVNAPLEDA